MVDVMTTDKVNPTQGVNDRVTVDSIDLRYLPPSDQKRVRKVLRPFAAMRDGKLGTINVTEHRIEVKWGLRPVKRVSIPT